MTLTSSCVALVHGWGGDPSLWESVEAGLGHIRSWRADLGFFGPADIRPPCRPVLAVGHSLGALLLLTAFDWDCPVVAVAGFPRFSASPDFPYGHPERTLLRMERRFAEDPVAVLSDFWGRVGARPARGVPCRDTLAQGLSTLRTAEGRPALGRVRIALAAEDDPLLSSAFYRDSFGDTLRMLPTGGHMLPVTRPADVVRVIREVLL